METVYVSLWWMFAGVLVYTYLLYPLLVEFAGILFSRPVARDEGYNPGISVVMSVRNEEAWIRQKIENLLSLEYPSENLEVIVGSDGSTDETEAILNSLKSDRVRVIAFEKNRGKPAVLNDLIRAATGEIIVFTDARQTFDKKALKMLVRNFADPKIGCVSGEMYFESGKKRGVGKGMNMYWNYEKYLRRNESKIHSMLGATGAIYAIRRGLYDEIPVNTLVDDMLIPLSIVQKGYRAIFDADAEAFDVVSSKGNEEKVRKIRTLAGNYQIFEFLPGLFNPLTSPVALQMFSHKFLRLAAPFFLIGLYLVNGMLFWQPFYGVIFVLQTIFYLMAGTEAWYEKKGHPRKGIGVFPYTFCLLNYSALMGLVKYLNKSQKATWEQAYA